MFRSTRDHHQGYTARVATGHPHGRALHVVQEDNTPPHAHVANITRL